MNAENLDTKTIHNQTSNHQTEVLPATTHSPAEQKVVERPSLKDILTSDEAVEAGRRAAKVALEAGAVVADRNDIDIKQVDPHTEKPLTPKQELAVDAINLSLLAYAGLKHKIKQSRDRKEAKQNIK